MNHELLKQVIYDLHAIIRESIISPREYSFDPNANYVLTGLRRAGKSTLIYSRAQELAATGVEWERILYINFEDERLTEFSAADFNNIVAVQSELSPTTYFQLLLLVLEVNFSLQQNIKIPK